MRLTDISVRALSLPEKGQKTHWDDTLENFGCRVSQGGTKSFVIQHGADRRLVTIGRYPIVSLADARIEAKRILAEMTLGKHRPRTVRWDEALNRLGKAPIYALAAIYADILRSADPDVQREVLRPRGAGFQDAG